MREIITLQLGSLSNYVGTHFWNAQEEYFDYTGNNTEKTNEINHDVLYRAGESANGVMTYTPRTLIYNLKGNFGSYQKYNKLFEPNSADINHTWDQGMTRIDRPIPKNKYQQELDRMDVDSEYQMDLDAIEQLESTVYNWSDFNRIYYHPRSMNAISTHQADDIVNPFDNYTIGKDAYVENEKEMNVFDDNFRLFAEECDYLQGFQILTDIDDAFGGFTEGLIHDIRDEFAKIPVLTYGLSDSCLHYRNDRMKQKVALNRALSMTRLGELSSIYVPIYTPTKTSLQKSHLQSDLVFNENSRYHTSAIIAAAIETNSLPFRLKKNAATLAESVSRLTYVRNTKLATLSVTLPLLKEKKGPLSLLDYEPSVDKEDIYSQTTIVRGSEQYAFPDPTNPLVVNYHVETMLPLPESYPRLFPSQ
ncbi:Protein dml1 [Rhizopus azygosporus]|uniref:Protein dml1 n=1 Tax=Rhizopus azygosporus TaxID=86630 RepID=A0A367IZ28_RHIAZ|nr:Protein dml1 [Rhizopus azygosporus]